VFRSIVFLVAEDQGMQVLQVKPSINQLDRTLLGPEDMGLSRTLSAFGGTTVRSPASMASSRIRCRMLENQFFLVG
jgi:hypothetical protein